MQNVNNSRERTFGYLTAVDSPEDGYFGGYLVISKFGRPLEFHCTAPIRPSQAQKILYGPTLQPYLLGEQICGALLGKAKLQPSAIITECAAVLHARPRSSAPIVFLTVRSQTPAEGVVDKGCRDHISDGYHLELAAGFESERDIVVDALAILSKHVDLMEPFNRIHEAIHEAQRISGRGTSSHEQAA